MTELVSAARRRSPVGIDPVTLYVDLGPDDALEDGCDFPIAAGVAPPAGTYVALLGDGVEQRCTVVTVEHVRSSMGPVEVRGSARGSFARLARNEAAVLELVGLFC